MPQLANDADAAALPEFKFYSCAACNLAIGSHNMIAASRTRPPAVWRNNVKLEQLLCDMHFRRRSCADGKSAPVYESRALFADIMNDKAHH